MRRLCHLSQPSSNRHRLSLFLFPPSPFTLWEIMWLFDLRRDEWQRFSKSSPVSITLRVKYQPWVSVSLGVCVRSNVYMSRLAHYAPGLSHTVTEGFDLPILSHTFIPTLPLLALFIIIFTLIFFFYSQPCLRCTLTHRPTSNLLNSTKICLMGAVSSGGWNETGL